MSYYRSSYVPAFTSNDTYGNFYDAPKVSLITVPDRLKNYDLEVRKATGATSAAEYGDFMRRDGLYAGPYGYARLQHQQQELRQEQQQQRQPLPPPPPPPQAAPLDDASSPSAARPPRLVYGPEDSDEDEGDEDRRQDSVRGPPPPASLERYRRLEGGPQQQPPPPPPPPPPQQQQPPPPPPVSPYQYRLSRSRSPPPPPDLGAYRSNPGAYTGRRGVDLAAASSSMRQPPQQPPPPQQLEPQLPPLRLGGREVHLPSIEAVEVRMRDKSKMVLDVRDFYRRYLGD